MIMYSWLLRVSYCLLGMGLLAGLGHLQAEPPDIEEFARRQQLAAQKAEEEVRQLLTQARQLETTNPQTAVQLLEKARERLRQAPELPEERRQELAALVEARLRQLQDRLRRPVLEAEQATPPARPRRESPSSSGKPLPADQARDYIERRRQQLTSSGDLRRQREHGYLEQQRLIDLSNVAVDRDLTFPKNWKDLTALRKKRFGLQLTKEEENVLRALNSVLSVEFNKTPFRDVIDFLQKKTGVTILVDKEALREAQVEYDDPVDFTAHKITFRTILRKILADHNLAYIVNKGVIEVVTPQKARETLVTYVYPVTDLLWFDPRAPEYIQKLQKIQSAAFLAEMIMNATDPGVWQKNGGPATISYDFNTESLVIRAPAEVHYTLSNKIR
jgi:hypothetical protein